jgi:ankyrin repeat protein
LIVAAQSGRLDLIALLIQRGADVNLAVEGDENPLMNAAQNGHLEAVKFLIDKGADVHARIWSDRGGTTDRGEWRTALSQARKSRNLVLVQYLESLGAKE